MTDSLEITAPTVVQAQPKPKKEAVCCECGETFVQNKSWQQFCCVEHRNAYGNRQTAEGKVMAAFVKAWRLKRGSGPIGKAALAELCSIVDSFNAADRDAGRPPATLYVEGLLATGYRYCDRARR